MRGGDFWASGCPAESQNTDRRHSDGWRLSFSYGYIAEDSSRAIFLISLFTKKISQCFVFFPQLILDRLAKEEGLRLAENKNLFGLRNSCRPSVSSSPRHPSTGLLSDGTKRNTKSSNGKVSPSCMSGVTGRLRKNKQPCSGSEFEQLIE